jgi:type IV pilus assembly protein PilY1
MKMINGFFLMVMLALLHGKPILAQECPENAAKPRSATVIYDSQARSQGAVIFKPGADGVLHALDAQSEAELWAYTPPNLDVTHRADGLLSDIAVLRFDTDRNGVIEAAAGDKVWVYFGLRRGGRHYYALDATDRSRAQLLWKIGPDELPGVGETWSTPMIARVRISGATQNGENLVVILGGGFDETRSSAHRVYMVDAASGALLWYAGGPGGVELPAAPDLPLMEMLDPVAARVAAIDTNADLFADRLYTADLGGRVWRFDIWTGRDRSQLVTGGVFAMLSDTAADARQFFNAPDVALIQRRGSPPYYNLAIGSGDRAHPFDITVHDRFYSLRDRNSFGPLTQAEYDALTPLRHADLSDITNTLGGSAVVPAAPGWALDLRLNGGWSGEKVLAEAVTVNGVILFPTYRPLSAATCSGENRIYALNVDQGAPVLDFNDDQRLTTADASTLLTQGGIAGEVELTLPPSGDSTPPQPGEPDPVEPRAGCKIGGEALRLCVTAETLLRTFWRRDSVN